MTTTTQPETEAQPEIRAIPVRHPGRWVGSAIVLLLTAMFVHMILTNKAFQWGFIRDNAFSRPVLNGTKNTLVLTALAMIIGVVVGIILAVMRLSPNPILSGGAWVYVWFFRAVPRVVLLILFGNLGVLYARYEVGIPFDHQIANLFGLSVDGRFFGVNANTVLTAFVAAILGLALSEAAYMAEIVRAGISSIEEGQTEAAQALGMSRGALMRRIILPQAMRVIVPPTGNETIAMIKDTSLVAFVPYYELFFQLQGIGSRTFQVFPMLVAACLWYLAMTSVLMVGQHYLEKRYARGTRRSTDRAEAKRLTWLRLPTNWGG
ncbi:MAG: amino acid ABC transporter permease [Actinomycetes bacterium]